MLSPGKLAYLKRKALDIRRLIVAMIHKAGSGHTGGSLSAADILVALYYEIMRHDPSNPQWPERDRFVLSKGHCAPVQYAVLADCGYFPKDDLNSLRRPGQHLQGHPNHRKTPGIEATTGSLGQGLSVALGMALAAKLRGQTHYYYVLCGDGEIQEGQIWEAALFGHKHKLDNVIAFVDRNYLQTDGYTEQIMPLDPLMEKWQSFGWSTFEIDGHDFEQIIETVNTAKSARGRPSMIIAKTTKGRGVSFIENDNAWHGKSPDDDEFRRAMDELSNGA